jgi:lipid-A-disaccharide synthase
MSLQFRSGRSATAGRLMQIYFVAGEASGDNHGAALMRSLRGFQTSVEFIGRGGPEMAAVAGAGFNNWIADAGVVGVWEVVRKYGYFARQFRAALSEVAASKPDAVVLIDYPGFNLRFARSLRRRGLTREIIYYISPQVWAWNRGRIKQMAKYLDLMLCIFPFEADLYNESGLRTKFVGHPMIDRLAARKIAVDRDPDLIGLFPGSRHREIDKILPVLLKTARLMRGENRRFRFQISAASESLHRQIEGCLERDDNGEKSPSEKMQINCDSADLMQRACAGVVASGSATLEATYFGLPFALVYKVSWPTYLIGRPLVRVNYLGMPNVLANRPVVPEFIQHDARPQAIAQAVLRLVNEPRLRDEMRQNFAQIIASLGEGGASRQAAEAILAELE